MVNTRLSISPLPEVGIAGVGFYGDFGISLDGSIWFELTVFKRKSIDP